MESVEKKNPKITPDLSGAKLRKTNLSGAILEGAIFEGTSFQIATHKGGIFKGDRVEILGVQKTVSVNSIIDLTVSENISPETLASSFPL